MGKDKRHNKNANGYKGVECQDLEKEINGSEVKIPPNPVIPVKPVQASNPYRIVGQCRLSKSGGSLSIRLSEGGLNQYRYLTILRRDLVALFTDGNNLTVADVREYDNPVKEQQKIIIA